MERETNKETQSVKDKRNKGREREREREADKLTNRKAGREFVKETEKLRS